jgi:ribosomal protein S18 acetylase RimI-like enzyme
MITDSRKEDYPEIANLNIKSYQEFAYLLPDGSWENMKKNLSNIEERSVNSKFLVYREDNVIVGSVAYCQAGFGDPAIFKPEWASILLLAVDPARRNQGIGKSLVTECINKAKSDGAAYIALFTSELMLSAQLLYKSLGFILESELPARLGVRYFVFLLNLQNN